MLPGVNCGLSTLLAKSVQPIPLPWGPLAIIRSWVPEFKVDLRIQALWLRQHCQTPNINAVYITLAPRILSLGNPDVAIPVPVLAPAVLANPVVIARIADNGDRVTTYDRPWSLPLPRGIDC